MLALVQMLAAGAIIDIIDKIISVNPTERCPGHSKTQCTNDPGVCMFSREGNCVPHRCYSLNDTACAAEPVCMQRRSVGFRYCGPQQKYAVCNYPESDCGSGSSAHCRWNNDTGLCMVRNFRGQCAAHEEEGGCHFRRQCDWHHGTEKCQVNNCQLAETPEHCEEMRHCSWLTMTSECKTRTDWLSTSCADIPRKLCGSNSLPCVLGTSGDCSSCMDHSFNAQSCNAKAGCMHTQVSRYGSPMCAPLKSYCYMQNPASCAGQHCLLVTPAVTGSPLTVPACNTPRALHGCRSLNTAQCLASPMCEMADGVCGYANVTCSDLPAAHCISYRQCGLDALTEECLPADVCPGLGSSDCAAEPGCTWFANRNWCRRANVNCNEEDKLRCNMKPRCGYHEQHGCVALSGCQGLDKPDCTTADTGLRCQWDDLKGCTPAGLACSKIDLSNALTCGGQPCDNVRSAWRGEVTMDGYGLYDRQLAMDVELAPFARGSNGNLLCPQNDQASCMQCEAGYTVNPFVRISCAAGGSAALSGQLCIKLGEECTRPFIQCAPAAAPEAASSFAPSVALGALVLVLGLLM